MILALAFSKDRALQLEALLKSFFMHALDSEDARIVILYRATEPTYGRQYDELAQEYGGRAQFVLETDFHRQLLHLLRAEGNLEPARGIGSRWFGRLPGSVGRTSEQRHPPCEHVLSLVDDTIFVRAFSLREAADALDRNPDALGFSFRLGKNTTYCYAEDRPQAVPGFEAVTDDILRYEWTRAEADFAYPLELSSSMYRLETFISLLSRLKFGNPNTLEGQMSRAAKHFRHRAPNLLCWSQSVAFSAPINRVQQVYANRAGTVEKLSVSSLAEAFDKGQRINVSALRGFVPSGCHQEVDLALEPGSKRGGAGE